MNLKGQRRGPIAATVLASTGEDIRKCGQVLSMDGRCPEGIDTLRVIEALREEAELRGISP